MPWSADEAALLVLLPTAFAAALLPLPGSWWLVGVLVLVAAVLVRPAVLVLALLAAIGVRADSAVAALVAVPTAPVQRIEVELVADPTPSEVSWRAVADAPAGRVMVEGRGAAGAALAGRAVGDRLVVSGTQRGSEPATSWQRSRGLVGRIDVTDVHSVTRSGGVRGVATAWRRQLVDGARSIPSGDRALFAGLVFGDDRDQRAVDADNFRAAGLGHLLAVSGQNVVFVLLVAAPVLSRIRQHWLRLASTIVVLALFGFLTRFEPSVTRALVMAGLAAAAATRGSPSAAVRVLPPAVLGLLLLFPLMAWSLAFQLSVAATSGLVVLSGRLEARLPLPRVIAAPLAATAAAQLAVSPLLLVTFGSVSLLALPANLLAGPAAAFAMMWGLTAGALAAVAPPVVAAVLHWPTRLAIDWITLVAATAADLPVGRFGGWHLMALLVGGGLAVRSAPLMRALGLTLATLALLLPLVFPPHIGPGTHVLLDGVVLHRSPAGHDVVVLDRTTGAERTLEALRHAHPDRIDLLLVTSGSRSAGRLVHVLTQRHDVVDIWAPTGHQVPGARVHPEAGTVGALTVDWPPDGAPTVRLAAGGSTATPAG
jgi:competence protein ComEC